MARFSEGSADLRIGGIRTPVDSDEAANKAYVDRLINTLDDTDGSIHARIDSEIRSLDSDITYILGQLDTEGGAAGSFRTLNDTPNSYNGFAGEFPRVNSDSDALEFFDPFPINSSDNRLTTLNGMRIRSIGTDYIEFATFQASAAFVSQTHNWDDPVTNLVFNVTNDDLVPTEYVTSVTAATVGGNAIAVTGFNSFSTFASTRQFTSNITFLDPSNTQWIAGGNSGNHAVTATFTTNLGTTVNASGNISWRSPVEEVSIDQETQFFDVVDFNLTVRGDVRNVTNPAANIGIVTLTNTTLDTDQQSSLPANASKVRTFTMDQRLLSNRQRTATLTGTRTRPDAVYAGADSDAAISESASMTPTTRHRTWGIVTTAGGLTASHFGTPSNSGYATPTGQVFYENDSNPNRSRASYGAGETGVSLYVVTRGTINGLQETTNASFPINQAVPTPSTITLGHTGNTYSYNVYEISLADNSGNFYTIT